MSRSLKKGPYIDAKLLKKVRRQEGEGVNEVIRTWARSCTVIPEFIGRTFEVHNGRGFQRVLIAEDMVGHKLGEFAPTRTYRGHGKEKGKTAKA